MGSDYKSVHIPVCLLFSEFTSGGLVLYTMNKFYNLSQQSGIYAQSQLKIISLWENNRSERFWRYRLWHRAVHCRVTWHKHAARWTRLCTM